MSEENTQTDLAESLRQALADPVQKLQHADRRRENHDLPGMIAALNYLKSEQTAAAIGARSIRKYVRHERG
jgi:hypothetical protein